MIRLLTTLLFVFLISIGFPSFSYPQPLLTDAADNFFIENKGQWASEVRYLAATEGMNAWLTNDGIVLDFYRFTQNDRFNETGAPRIEPARSFECSDDLPQRANTSVYGHVLKMNYIGGNTNANVVSSDRLPGYHNYFLGSDASKYAAEVHRFRSAAFQDVYQGIGINYYFDEGQLRYDYIAAPGADVSRIRFRIEGADQVRINENGELVMQTGLGDVVQGKLYAYQENTSGKTQVPCSFILNTDGSVSVSVPSYDISKTLVIDPLIYSTFLGGQGNDDRSTSHAVDTEGNVLITGYANSLDFPTTPGAYDQTFGGYSDIFITKLNSSGSALIFSTFIGGSGEDAANSIALDITGNSYITGSTTSTDYPTTAGAYDQTHNGGSASDPYDVFITKLNSTGTALVYSTFIGGSDQDAAYSIALDGNGNAGITGSTFSANFPATAGAFDQTKDNDWDVFVTKINNNGSALLFSTFLGDVFEEAGFYIAFDGNNNPIVTGRTRSSEFPTTAGAFDITYNTGGYDAFITKLNSSGSALMYSTFLGGTQQDEGYFLALDVSGNAVITGYTRSSDFPTTAGAFDQTFNDGIWDAFVTKLNSTGTALIYSTYLGGTNKDIGYAVSLDEAGNAVITGLTASTDFPVTPGAFDETRNGSTSFPNDAFVTKLNSSGSVLTYSTYLGGSQNDYGNCASIGSDGFAVITGVTGSADFPTTTGSYNPSDHGYNDAFITKIEMTAVNGIDDVILPSAYLLKQNFPNPFNPTTTISFEIPEASFVQLAVYTVLGEELMKIVNEELPAGRYEYRFDARSLPSGLYFCKMQTDKFSETMKMMLVK